jgi:inner membrane protein
VDSLTQAVLGAAVGELVLGKKLGWRGAVWGVFFGTLPDLDVIALPFLDPAAGIYWHRGLSHSILIMVVAAVLLARPLAKFHQAEGVTTREMGWMVFWAWSTHVLIDCLTTYGTQIFEPFSHERVAANLVFIVDPLVTLPLLVGLVRALRTDSGQFRKRRRLVVGGIGVSCLYLGFALVMKFQAEGVMARDLKAAHPEGRLVAVAPTSFNTILWRGLIETEESYLLTYWSPFDSAKATYEVIPKTREIARDFEGEDALEALKWFSRGNWVARKGGDGRLVIIDPRFAEIRDPRSGTLEPIFQWHLDRDEEGEVRAPMERPKGLDYAGAFGVLWQRIWGRRENWDAMQEF